MAAYSHRRRNLEMFDSYYASLNKHMNDKEKEELQQEIDTLRLNQGKSLVRDLIESIMNKELDIEVTIKKVPKQTNLHDCGLYTMEYIRSISQGTEMSFHNKKGSHLRKQIKKELELGRLEDTLRETEDQDPRERGSKMKDNREHREDRSKRKEREHDDNREHRENSSKRKKGKVMALEKAAQK